VSDVAEHSKIKYQYIMYREYLN